MFLNVNFCDNYDILVLSKIKILLFLVVLYLKALACPFFVLLQPGSVNVIAFSILHLEYIGALFWHSCCSWNSLVSNKFYYALKNYAYLKFFEQYCIPRTEFHNHPIRYVLSFSLGAGPVPALLLPEIFASRIRAKAVALSLGMHWVCCSELCLF